MNARHWSRFLAVVAVALAQSRVARAASNGTNALTSTISASRQFTAYANNQLLPSALCVYAERVKHEWLQRMDVADTWRDPILLVVSPREPARANAPAISMAVFQTENHLKYQINCLLPPPLDEAELLVTMVDSLCSEWANRDQPVARGRLYAAPVMPPWLVQGLAASIQGRFDFLLAIARRSVAAGRPQQATEVLDVKVLPIDPADRQLFRANAWLFTESLLALPDGSRKLRSFLSGLGTEKVASNAFWTVYHQDFPERAALEKWWNLEEARRTSVTVAENLSAVETAHQLNAILVAKIGPTKWQKGMPEETETTIDKLWQYTDEAWLTDVLKLKISQFGALRAQAHPSYQPVLDEYIEAMTWLFQSNTVRFRRAVKHAAVGQAAVDKQSRAIAVYMDQAERAYAPEELSQVFNGYFQAFDQAQKLEGERRSPISDYLDKFDH
ncbi:MAG TPA: hypothetical protein VNL17_13460 [Verrucomicrobiae bacterium]|nr:hypothetical protein [Verrucomicrobiae bacterium]